MARKFIDLSIGIEEGLPSDPPQMIPRIQYMGHKEGAESMRAFFPGLEEDWKHKQECIRISLTADDPDLVEGIKRVGKTVKEIYK